MITTADLFAARGGEARVRRAAGGSTAEQDLRITSAVEAAIAEFQSRLAPALGSSGRARAAALESNTAPAIIKSFCCALAWYNLLTATSDKSTEDLILLKDSVDKFFKGVYAGQVDLGLEPETAINRQAQIRFRRTPNRYSRSVDPNEVPG